MDASVEGYFELFNEETRAEDNSNVRRVHLPTRAGWQARTIPHLITAEFRGAASGSGTDSIVGLVQREWPTTTVLIAFEFCGPSRSTSSPREWDRRPGNEDYRIWCRAPNA